MTIQPHIFSNGYHVRFSEDPDQDCGIGYIVPEWVGGKPYLSTICDIYGSDKVLPTTIILLPLKPEKVEAVKAQLSELHPELLLFLSKIKRLSVCGNTCNSKEDVNVSDIFISTETDHVALSDKSADSRVLHLSVKEDGAEETCRYYIWRETFPVKPANEFSARNDVKKCVISIAFPFGERLKRGTSAVGIFAFLPTAMITNFPFVIQADFVLASSRETILLDNKWNLGILECIPSAFFHAFISCVKKDATTICSVAQAFEFLPARSSTILELNNIRKLIKNMLQGEAFIPCEMFDNRKHFCTPQRAIRILPKFREILFQMKEQGVPLGGMFSLKENVIHSSIDLIEFTGILDYLGVPSVDNSYQWYGKCIEFCNLVLSASEDAYMELLCFLADNEKISSLKDFKKMLLFKCVNRKGHVRLCSIATRGMFRIYYSQEPKLHAWLTECNIEFECPDDMCFLPSPTLEALISHKRSSLIMCWLKYNTGLSPFSAVSYCAQISDHLMKTDEPRFVIKLAHFLYHAHCKKFIMESMLYGLCTRMPVIDGSNCIRRQKNVTLVSAPGSKWKKLFGPSNPFSENNYVDIGKVYAEGGQFAGECTPKGVILSFLSTYTRAVDIPELHPPNVVLKVASSKLTSEQGFLLLDWIRFLRTKGSDIPAKFIESIRDGRWMKTYLGFNSPNRCILPDEAGKTIFGMMRTVVERFSILDQDFYMNRITLYADELKFLGVRFGSDGVQKLLVDRFKSLAASGMSKECAFSLLMFIGILKGKNMLDEAWLGVMREGKWLKTFNGYNAPRGSVFLQSEIEANAILTITSLPLVDTGFYGSNLSSFSSELTLLGVVLDMKVYELVEESLNFPADLSSLTWDSGFLILKCIRYLGSATSSLVEKTRNQRWLKTSCGFKRPLESVLVNPEFMRLLDAFEVPIIDEAFYGNTIRSFAAELKAIGVAVDLNSALKLIVTQFKSFLSSSSLTPVKVISLLECIREINENVSSQLQELHQCLLGEKWLRTRNGYRTPSESILFSSKWGTISLFVDLPLIDDSFYGIVIYGFEDELKMLGVITGFEGGAPFVARGLTRPIEPRFVTDLGTIALLECIKYLMSKSNDQPLLDNFFSNLMRSKWLKTRKGYKKPEECILFDPTWEVILEETDAPMIEHTFYKSEIFMYKNQLRAIGVKVDPGDVCSLLSRCLMSLTETSSITRVYNFLHMFNWKPELPDKDYQVWVINHNGNSGGEWVNSQLCILHDKDNVFNSHLYALDKCYQKELLPFFSSAFAVAEFPSIDDYMWLWDSLVMRVNSQVTAKECCSFWDYILKNWSPHTEDFLKKRLTKVPATTSTSERIHLVSKELVFIPDDLQLKHFFSSIDGIPLFVWLPKCKSFSTVHPMRLFEIYESLGVRKISGSVECHASISHSLDQYKMDPRNGLIGRGLVRIVLGFIAGPRVSMPVEERHKVAKLLLGLSVFESREPILVSYQLLLTADKTLEVEAGKLVFWDKNSCRLLIDKSGYEDRKSNIKFVSCFAREIAEGLLACEKADAIENLSKIIQIGFMFEFKEESMVTLLTSENLELFAEDEKFLDAACLLSKQSPVIRSLPVMPPIDDNSQLLTQPNLKESRWRKVPNYPDPPKFSSSSLYPKRRSQQLELLSPPTPESSQKKPRQ